MTFESHFQTAQDWLRLTGRSLAGLSEATARHQIEDAGYVARFIRSHDPMTADLRANRITCLLSEEGLVESLTVG